jgi:DNA-binding LacI/PurR family transcriptional regulator
VNERHRVGIKDVAREAGVSITTVSHAMSGKGRLAEDTRERVREVATRLGYQPHPSARSLASGRTGLIAMVVSAPAQERIAFTEIDYYVELINAATHEALDHGMSLVLAPSTAGAANWNRLPLDGVIVIDPADGDDTIPMLRDRGLPMVFVGADPNGEPDDLVVQNDRRAATRSVLDHLAGPGGTVGLVTLAPIESFGRECIAAYDAWCFERGQAVVRQVADADSTISAAELRAFVDGFLARPDRPDAVFCLYERIGVEMLAAAEAAGVSVPRDLRVATISELGTAPTTDPPLTTLEIHQARLGEMAAGMLAALLADELVGSVYDVPTELVARASSRIAP